MDRGDQLEAIRRNVLAVDGDHGPHHPVADMNAIQIDATHVLHADQAAAAHMLAWLVDV